MTLTAGPGGAKDKGRPPVVGMPAQSVITPGRA